MRKLILDQYSHQSLFKRFLGNTLTVLGWAFWIYLWLPLFAAIKLLLGAHSEQVTSEASHSILALVTTLASHAGMVVIMILIFIGWSLLQWIGKRYRREAIQKWPSKVLRSLILPATKPSQDMLCWQHVQSMVVRHDDTSGLIQRVEILKGKSKIAQREYPSPYLGNLLPNSKRQFDFIVRSIH